MSSSSEESSDEDYLFFKDNDTFADITPITQDDGPRPVVQIAYSDAFKDAYDYFRAIYAKKELSQRALTLTAACIKHNPANYTVWEYRRQIVKHLNVDIVAELEYTRARMGTNPKNYQMWHHRSELLGFKDTVLKADIQRELDLVRFVVEHDSKNYHAWQHRVCLLQNSKYREFFEFEDEVAFAQELISSDYRNNSAWNYLYTLHSQLGMFQKFNTTWLEETIFVTNANDLQNEASWSFLSGIFPHLSDQRKEHFYRKTLALVDELTPQVPHYLIGFLLDVYQEMGLERSTLKSHVNNLKTTDPVRENYWTFVETTLS